MTTTDHLQRIPDYYKELDECKKHEKDRENTNKRYKFFKQTHFTAGDEEQFQRYRCQENGEICPEKISLKQNVFKDFEIEDFDKYKNINPTTVYDTFSYIFNKFKKGIFIKILDNKLKVFLPFSKVKFRNEWYKQIRIDPKYNRKNPMIQFLSEISKESGYKFQTRFLKYNINEWFANNCLIRYDKTEGDTNVAVFKDMLTTLCEKREVPDIELFLNRRDFPILTKDSTEPYNNIWDGFIPLKSHSYEKYSPILSMSKTDRYADVLIPTHDDWGRITKGEKWFPRKCEEKHNYELSWESKKDVAVFRGSSTGCGVRIETNKRLKLAKISQDNKELLDAGITKWKTRPKKIEGEEYLQYLKPGSTGISKSDYLTAEEQSKYKYIVHVEGNVEAFRLSDELEMGSVLLIVKGKWKIWYSDLLIPYVHYVPVEADLSDIISQIKWCRANDTKCKEIAKAALNFHNKYLKENGVLDFLQKTFVTLKSQMGNYLYNFTSPLDVQINFEKSHNTLYYPEREYTSVKNFVFPRSFGKLQAVGWLLNNFLSGDNPIKGDEIFHNKLGTVHNYTFQNCDMVIKSTTDPKKIKEHIHENFVGKNVINDMLKTIPNFAYTFNSYEDGDSYNVIMEKVKGYSLQQYLSNSEFSFDELYKIMIQIALAIKVAQNKCGFVHYDLVPWNIMIRKLSQKVTIDYSISHHKSYKITTNVIAIIIDYGKSHVIYKGKHYGFINMFDFNASQDIRSLILTSLNTVLKHKLTHRDQEKFLYLTRFLKPGLKRFYDAKNYINARANYSDMISIKSNSHTVLDFVKYLNDKAKLLTHRSEGVTVKMDSTNSKRVLNYMLSNTLEEKIESFLSVFNSVKKCKLPRSKNTIYNYYAAQKILSNLRHVYKNLQNFLLHNNKSVNEYSKEYEAIVKTLVEQYTKIISESNFEYVTINKKQDINLQENTFLTPHKVLDMLDSVNLKKLNVGFLDMRDIVLYVLKYKGKLEITPKHKIECIKKYGFLFRSTYLPLVIDSANVKTLVSTSAQVYSNNIKCLDKKK